MYAWHILLELSDMRAVRHMAKPKPERSLNGLREMDMGR
jgi:hypothetical protein